MAIDIAVVPVAGRGTRLLPVAKSQPKEMLPVGRKPVVQYVVEELTRCGVGRVLFVTWTARALSCELIHYPVSAARRAGNVRSKRARYFRRRSASLTDDFVARVAAKSARPASESEVDRRQTARTSSS